MLGDSFFKEKIHPLGEGEQIVTEYFLDNTRLQFQREVFYAKLVPFIIPGLLYLLDVFTQKQRARIVLTNWRFIYEVMLTKRQRNYREVVSFDIKEISSVGCEYSAYEICPGVFRRLFGGKDKKNLSLAWEINSPHGPLYSDSNLLAMKKNQSMEISNSENFAREASGIIYQIKENSKF